MAKWQSRSAIVLNEVHTTKSRVELQNELEAVLLAANLSSEVSTRLATWSGDYITHMNELTQSIISSAIVIFVEEQRQHGVRLDRLEENQVGGGYGTT